MNKPTCFSTSKLVSVCAWCPDNVQQTARAHDMGFDVTHGICRPCADKQIAEFRASVATK